MATLLEDYNQKKASVFPQILQGTFPVDQLLQYQELLYRIDVLESCRLLSEQHPLLQIIGSSGIITALWMAF